MSSLLLWKARENNRDMGWKKKWKAWISKNKHIVYWYGWHDQPYPNDSFFFFICGFHPIKSRLNYSDSYQSVRRSSAIFGTILYISCHISWSNFVSINTFSHLHVQRIFKLSKWPNGLNMNSQDSINLLFLCIPVYWSILKYLLSKAISSYSLWTAL